MAGPKPMLIEFGIHHRLESCVKLLPHIQNECACAAYTKPYQRLGDNCWNYVLINNFSWEQFDSSLHKTKIKFIKMIYWPNNYE